jgi:hypothetical protein
MHACEEHVPRWLSGHREIGVGQPGIERIVEEGHALRADLAVCDVDLAPLD